MSGGSELRIEKCIQQFVFVKVALTEIYVCEKYTDVRSILCSASYNITDEGSTDGIVIVSYRCQVCNYMILYLILRVALMEL